MEAAYDNFCPNGVPAREKVIMTMDACETIREESVVTRIQVSSGA